MYIFDNHNQEW